MIHIVIDANIARSCNDPATNEQAAQCFLFLTHVARRENDIGVVANDELEAEWDIHGNRTFTKWLARMETRKRVKHIKTGRLNDYRKVVAAVASPKARVALEKDIHLVELAIHGQHPVASRDEAQRTYVTGLCGQYPLLASIQWVNPVTQDGWTEWLERGCDRASFALQS